MEARAMVPVGAILRRVQLWLAIWAALVLAQSDTKVESSF